MNKRLEFSRKTKAEIINRANGKCEACKAILKPGEGEVDHILPDALGGKPTVANGRWICRPCHKNKTAGDIRKIRKADRVRDKASGAMRKPSKFPILEKETKTLSKALPPKRAFYAKITTEKSKD